MSMKIAVLDEPRKIRMKNVDKPTIGDNHILIRIRRCGICGTGLHLYRGDWPEPWGSPKYPVEMLEAEFSGDIVEIGKKVEGFREGDRVAGKNYNLFCGKCYFCKKGKTNLCDDPTGGGTSPHPEVIGMGT